MYIKSQINKILDVYSSYTYNDKIIEEINKILNKDIITKEDKLKVNKLIQTLYKDINEVY